MLADPLNMLFGAVAGAFIGAVLFWFVFGITGWPLVLPGGTFALVGLWLGSFAV